VPKAHQDVVSAAFRSIFALTNADELRTRYDEVTEMLAAQFTKTGDLLAQARNDVLAFAAFPLEHWRKIWSNNPLERLNKEVKRRTNVVGIFPNDTAVIRLVGAVLADQHDEWAIARRYLTESSLTALTTRDTEPAQLVEATPDPLSH